MLHYTTRLLGDFDAKVDKEKTFRVTISWINVNESATKVVLNISLAIFKLIAKSSFFEHKDTHILKYRWPFSDGEIRNQIDHIVSTYARTY